MKHSFTGKQINLIFFTVAEKFGTEPIGCKTKQWCNVRHKCISHWKQFEQPQAIQKSVEWIAAAKAEVPWWSEKGKSMHCTDQTRSIDERIWSAVGQSLEPTIQSAHTRLCTWHTWKQVPWHASYIRSTCSTRSMCLQCIGFVHATWRATKANGTQQIVAGQNESVGSRCRRSSCWQHFAAASTWRCPIYVRLCDRRQRWISWLHHGRRGK